MGARIQRQAKQLYEVFVELVRRYQFRDREGICCHGLSVSQCYALEALVREGPLTMGQLAGRLALDVSTMTRIVDHLIDNGLAARKEDPQDRRIRRVSAMRKGTELASRIRGELLREYELVLEEVPAESRDAVIKAIGHLLAAFEERSKR